MLAVFVLAALLTRSPAPIHAQTDAAAHAGVVVVVSPGQAKGTPDMAMFRAGVDASGSTPNDALQQTDAQMQSVLSTLRQFSIADSDIQTSGLNLFPIYAATSPDDNGPAQINGYRATNGATINVRDLGKLSPMLEALANAGISDVGSVQFGISDTSALHAQAIADAVQRSRPLAQAAAGAAGLTLGGIQAIEELSPTGATAFASGGGLGGGQGGTPVQAGSLTVDVQVQVAYGVASP
jgi:uncharacterized protein